MIFLLIAFFMHLINQCSLLQFGTIFWVVTPAYREPNALMDDLPCSEVVAEPASCCAIVPSSIT